MIGTGLTKENLKPLSVVAIVLFFALRKVVIFIEITNYLAKLNSVPAVKLNRHPRNRKS